MSSTCNPRLYGQEYESYVQFKPTGQIRLLQICLNYEGTQSPLNCFIDGDRVRELAMQRGVKDIVQLYDNYQTELYPSIQNVEYSIVSMCQRSQPGDYIIIQYSGHGSTVADTSGDEQSGKDSCLCLRNQDTGKIESYIDDRLAEVLSKFVPSQVPVLFMVDACHSGTIIDLNKNELWYGKRILCLSGCQDYQTSIDTGDGGKMTNALLEVVKHPAIKPKIYRNQASIQYVFNRMTSVMKKEEMYIEEPEQEYYEEDEYYYGGGEYYEDYQYDASMFEPINQPPGKNEQTINLSWNGDTDPTILPFPF